VRRPDGPLRLPRYSRESFGAVRSPSSSVRPQTGLQGGEGGESVEGDAKLSNLDRRHPAHGTTPFGDGRRLEEGQLRRTVRHGGVSGSSFWNVAQKANDG